MIKITDIIDAITFITTIGMVGYGLKKGFNFTELLMNVFYFSTLLSSMTIRFLNKE